MQPIWLKVDPYISAYLRRQQTFKKASSKPLAGRQLYREAVVLIPIPAKLTATIVDLAPANNDRAIVILSEPCFAAFVVSSWIVIPTGTASVMTTE